MKPLRTNTPLQALAIMNDVQYIEAARPWPSAPCRRNRGETNGSYSRFVACWGVALAQRRSPYSAPATTASWSNTAKFLKKPRTCSSREPRPGDSSLNAAEHAALTGVVLTLFNLDETLTTRIMAKAKATTRRVIAQGRFLQLVNNNGWEYVERAKASGVVAVIAVTVEQQLILTEQFRPPSGRA